MAKFDAYQEVTDKILQLMEEHGTDWVKPWKSDGIAGMPYSIGTGKAYRGINTVMLWSSGFADPRFGTFKAWQAKGHKVKKGSKGTKIVFLQINEYEDKKTGDKKRIPMLRMSTVFNAAQVEDVEPLPTAEPLPEVERIAKAEAFIKNTGARFEEVEGFDSAYFAPSADLIRMPAAAQFDEIEEFYSTAMHELTHWTGHASRLDRLKRCGFGSSEYAKEELVAEMGAAFLCADLGISNTPRPDHAKYLNNWMRGLKNDKKLIVQAASHAAKAAQYLHDLQKAESEAVSEAA